MTTPGVVGRAHELELLRAAVTAGRDVLLEGPPGTSKTTMLRAITADWGVPLMFVEGNADLTTGKLVGHHAPDRVLREGYLAENFVDGPLVEAMRLGGFLYIEELNRSPQDTLNTLLSAIGDRRLTIPRIGTITAKSTFRLIASMNPFDNVGTMRISMSIYDRLCRLAVGYQDEALEREIVEQRASSEGDPLQRDDRLVRDAVALVRATRDHPDVRHGSSVRGAIDTVLVARELGRARQVIVDLPGTVRRPGEAYRALVLDAITVALSGRIQLDPTAVMTAEQVLHDIWESYFLSLAAASGGENAVVADSPLRRDRPGDPNAPFRRKPKTLDEPPTLSSRPPTVRTEVSPSAVRGHSSRHHRQGLTIGRRPARVTTRANCSRWTRVRPTPRWLDAAHEIASRLALVRHRDRRPRSGGAVCFRARRSTEVPTRSTSTRRWTLSSRLPISQRRTWWSAHASSTLAPSPSSSTSQGRCAASGSGRPQPRWVRWPARWKTINWRSSRSGRTRHCCSRSENVSSRPR